MKRIRFVVIIFSAMIFMTACNLKKQNELFTNNTHAESEVSNQQTYSADMCLLNFALSAMVQIILQVQIAENVAIYRR